MASTELTLHELEAEMAVELPERQALQTTNTSHIYASNHASAINFRSRDATATASATQTIVVVQFRDVNLLFG